MFDSTFTRSIINSRDIILIPNDFEMFGILKLELIMHPVMILFVFEVRNEGEHGV